MDSISSISSTPFDLAMIKAQSKILDSATTGDTQNQSFSSLISMMMLSSLSSSSSSDGGLPESNMMAPLLFNLLEQLIASQMEQENSLSSQGVPSGLPAQGPLTQDYHTGHNGIDIGVPVGTPIQATMSGQVIYSGWNNEGYGNLVIVQNGAYKTYYAHLSELPVSVGQSVQAGAVIGLSGNTGNSTGPHLHYEVRQNDQPINPAQTTGSSGF